jgi:glc operon protein GlcG
MSITLERARHVVDRALEAAAGQSVKIAAVVLDTGGHIVAAARMDGVGPLNLDVARRKANAVVNLGVSTAEMLQMISRDQLITTVLHAEPSIVLLPGGMPLKDGDALVGALGIAGGFYPQDQAIGEYAIAE